MQKRNHGNQRHATRCTEIDENVEDSSYTKDVTVSFKRCDIVADDTKTIPRFETRQVGIGWEAVETLWSHAQPQHSLHTILQILCQIIMQALYKTHYIGRRKR